MNKESVHEESLASLVNSLQHDLTRLVDAEKALAREEINGKLREIKKEAILLAGGAVLGGLVVLCLVTASILALATLMAPALAALVVGGGLGVIAAIFLTTFRARNQNLDPVPRETVANIKRDVRAVREAVR
jgi:dethiobiotin synthetase